MIVDNDGDLRLHEVAEAAPVGLGVVAHDGAIALANAALRRLVGGATRLQDAAPDDHPLVAECLAVAAGGDPCDRQVRLHGVNGVRTVSLRVEHGRVDGELLVVLTDMTDLALALDSLLRRESELRLLTAAAPLGVFAVSGSGWTYANARMEEITGLPSEALFSHSLLDLIHPDDAVLLRRDWDRARRRGGEAARLVRLRHADGRVRWVRVRLADAGEGRWIGTAEDTTSEVLARDRADRLAEVVEATTDVVIVAAPDQRLEYVNGAGRRLLGLGADTAVADLTIADLVTPTTHELLEAEGLPAACAGGTWHGEAGLRRNDGVAVPASAVVLAHADREGRVDRISLVMRDISEQHALQSHLERAATHDALTGLPNRTLFNRQLERAVAHAAVTGRRVAVLFCDLDRFKVVNDSRGHAVGDRLLVEAAARLRRVLRESDFAARVGGDEFLVLCSDLGDPDDAEHVAARVRAALAAPFTLGGGERTRLGCSIGIAVSDPAAAGQGIAERLVADADAAMYHAKRLGRGRTIAATPGRVASRETPLDAEIALGRALRNEQLRLYFQPIVRVADAATVACEALVRWEHPERGLLLPEVFLSLAEDTGLIHHLGEWVMAGALEQAAAWRRDLGDAAPQVAVNLSARQLERPDLAEEIARMLGRYEIPARKLTVEITETVLTQDLAAVAGSLAALRTLGVAVALDDFGTGYSSLSHLQQLPLDMLKIDRSFVAGLGAGTPDTEIVRSLLALAQALGVEAVAEGVETGSQLARLAALGCGLVQGYRVAKPAPAAAVTASLLLDAAASG